MRDLEIALPPRTRGSYHSVHEDPEWQKSSGLTKECHDVPELQGIPIPKQPLVRCDRLLQTLIAALLVVSPVLLHSCLKQKSFISASKVSIDVSNCHVLVEDGEAPGVATQHWPFMGSLQERWSGDTLRLAATMRPRLSSWFRCGITVVAPFPSQTTHSLTELNVTVSDGELPVAVLLTGGKVWGPIQITAKSKAVINATAIQSQNSISIRSREPGLVNLQIGRKSATSWKIQGASPVFVKSNVPVEIKSAALGVLRAPEVQDLGWIIIVAFCIMCLCQPSHYMFYCKDSLHIVMFLISIYR